MLVALEDALEQELELNVEALGQVMAGAVRLFHLGIHTRHSETSLSMSIGLAI